jgi:glycosyltransferase involved in cell wall biosynthesis
MMKIFSILCVKNEGDLIEECLRKASAWSDRIFVYDGASTDGTWEKVQSMANSRIVAARSDDRVWNDWLRAEIFEEFRHEANTGDWWCRLDADEFYVDDPRVFLASVDPLHHAVWGLNIEYFLTEEALAMMPGGDAPLESPLEYLRYYRCKYCEPRFFRYRERLRWYPRDSAPTHMGLASPKLIRFRHIPYRFPKQIQHRLRQRMKSVADGHEGDIRGGWHKIVDDDWRKKGLRHPSELHYDARNGHFEVQWEKLPDYLGPWWRRAVQYACHRFGIWP